ncbi:hypothetical protein N9R81_02630 [Flavobacteriales bacterium]|nr:hypothetical protein [Flavobacteriales bacterium]
MTKLGELFKKNAEKQSFPSADRQWGALESMLDERDAKKRRGGGYRWLFGTSTLLLILLFGWYLQMPSEIIHFWESTDTIVNHPKFENTNESNKKQFLTAATSSPLKIKSNADNEKTEQQNYASTTLEKRTKTTQQTSDNHITKSLYQYNYATSSAISSALHQKAAVDISIHKTNHPQQEYDVSNNKQENLDITAQVKEAKPSTTSDGLDASDVITSKGNSNTSNPLAKKVMEDLFLMCPVPFELENSLGYFPSFNFEENKSPIMRLEVEAYGGAMFVDKYLSSPQEFRFLDRRNSEEQPYLSHNIGIDATIKRGKFTATSGFNLHQQGEFTHYANRHQIWNQTAVTDYMVEDNSHWNAQDHSFTAINEDNFVQQTDTFITYYDAASGTYISDTVTYQQYVINNVHHQPYTILDSVYVMNMDTVGASTRIDSSLIHVTDGNPYSTKNRNSFSYVEIPILLGYEFPLSRLSIQAKTGIGFGLLTNYHVTYLHREYTLPVLLGKSQVKQTIVNYIARISLSYALNENWSFRITPHYRLNLTNVLNQDQIRQKYWNVGVNFGVVFSPQLNFKRKNVFSRP